MQAPGSPSLPTSSRWFAVAARRFPPRHRWLRARVGLCWMRSRNNRCQGRRSRLRERDFTLPRGLTETVFTARESSLSDTSSHISAVPASLRHPGSTATRRRATPSPQRHLAINPLHKPSKVFPWVLTVRSICRCRGASISSSDASSHELRRTWKAIHAGHLARCVRLQFSISVFHDQLTKAKSRGRPEDE